MSVCSNEVCSLSEKKSAVKAMASLTENPNRASPVPFDKGEVIRESFNTSAQGTVQKSENVGTSDEGHVQITQKTKVEESFVKSQKLYTAEIRSSSHQTQVLSSSPEMEQIMTKRQMQQTYQDSSQQTPNTLSIQQKTTQPERCLTPELENLMEKPHGSWSPMPPACFVRPMSPSHIVSFPPDIPPIPATLPHPRTATPEQYQEARETVERFVDHTKQAHLGHSVTSNRSAQSSLHQSQFSSFTQQSNVQQYTPRYDMSQGFSAYQGSSNPGNQGNHGNGMNSDNPHIGRANINGNGRFATHENEHSGHENPRDSGNENASNHGNGNPGNHGNGRNPGNPGNGNPSNPADNGSNNSSGKTEDKPKVAEPDNSEEKPSRKSSRTDQNQKSFSEEESSRRVFSDFGGPQKSSSVEIESTTEGGVQKTSVKKSEKTTYSSCEFESSRQSSIKQNGESIDISKGNGQKKASSESRQQSQPTFTAGESSASEEETLTKSQVEEIVKQELNKVFQMAQTMEKTNFGEMYDLKSKQTSSEEHSKIALEQSAIQASETFEQKLSSSQYTGEVITKTGKLTSGLTIAPDRPFTPQALESNYPLPYQNMPSDFPPPRFHPEPPPEKPTYAGYAGDRDSPLLQALTIASDRPYSPLPSATFVETPSFITAPKSKPSSMLEALTTAPSTPFHIKEIAESTATEFGTVQKTIETKYETAQKYVPRPTQGDFKPIIMSATDPKPNNNYVATTQTTQGSATKSFLPDSDELKSAFKSTTKLETLTFNQSQRQQAEVSGQTVESTHQRSLSASRAERPLTPSGLNPPSLLPYYQQNIGEIPLAHRSNSPVPHQIKAPMITPPRSQSLPRQGERRGSVKAMSEAYTQQLAAVNNQQQQSTSGTSSVSYVSAGAYSSGSVAKSYSYEQEHKSIDAMGYHASPLAGKLPLAGEQTMPKCSSPLLGKLDHTKQVFKPSIPVQQPVSVFRSPVAEQANLKQAPPYFVQEKEKPPAPWVVIKEKSDEMSINLSTFKESQKTPPTYSIPQPTTTPSLPSFPNLNKKLPIFPEPPKPFSLPGVTKPPSAIPDAGPGGAPKGGTTAGTSAPRRGRGVLNTTVSAGGRIPLCGSCNNHIRGPFITALGKIWCPDHFVCVNAQCRRPLQDIGFVEDAQGLYCEFCFEQYLAPSCSKCNAKVKGDCLNAIGKHFHPECFTCAYCGKLFGNSPFFLEDALPYCENDWNELFTTKCFSCGFPIEAGDRWVEALNNNYHSQCFNCTMCKKNLEGQSFFAKGGRPFCKNHAR